ncbi:unnamed protein product [Calypogeia fissa]
MKTRTEITTSKTGHHCSARFQFPLCSLDILWSFKFPSSPHPGAKFTRKRKNASSSIISAASQHEGNSAAEAAQLSVNSKDGRTLTKKLGGIVCGVCTAASIIPWDLLPAFADELPPPADVSSVATPYAKSADRLKMGLGKG